MLTRDENRLLTEVGPGTPVGELVRRYWIPALTVAELPEPNADPVRLRLAGGNFVVWRDSAGNLGLFDEYCMHRGASLALGRCEGDGLRCLYHGWKFAVDGTILETPNYKKPTIRERLTAPVYPIREAGGLCWVFLGPRDKEPPFPHYRFMDANPEHLPIYHATIDCNFVQIMEGTIDPSHPHILHQDPDKLGSRYEKNGDRESRRNYVRAVNARTFVSDDLAPVLEVDDTLYGCQGASFHDATADGELTTYVRVHDWVMPFMAIPSPHNFVISVPLDDHTTSFFVISEPEPDDNARDRSVRSLSGPDSLYAGCHYLPTARDRWGQDRSSMSNSFTGIPGVATEDFAVCLSMGPVCDRSRENLVPADQVIIRMRRRMLQAAHDLQNGVEPYMLKNDEASDLGAEQQLLSDRRNWRRDLLPHEEKFRLIQREREHADA